MDAQRVSNIEEIRAELAEVIQHYGAMADLHRKYSELQALLAAIVAETKPEPDGSRMVAIGGGWRRLPDDLAQLINEAATLVTSGNR